MVVNLKLHEEIDTDFKFEEQFRLKTIVYEGLRYGGKHNSLALPVSDLEI